MSTSSGSVAWLGLGSETVGWVGGSVEKLTGEVHFEIFAD